MRKKTAIQVFVPLVIAITALTSCKGGSNAINSRIPIVAATAAAIHNVDTSAVADAPVVVPQEDTAIAQPDLTFADTTRLVALPDTFYEGPYKIQPFFGYNTQYGEIGDNQVPSIPGLCFMSTGTNHFGVRCPNKENIRLWAAGKMADFASRCIKGADYHGKCVVPTYTKARNSKDICQYYYDIISRESKPKYTQWGGQVVAEQRGYLLFDIWNTPFFTTMQEVTWYDFASCGDQTTRSWYTISRKTGKPMTVKEIVADADRTALGALLLKHLTNASESYLSAYPDIKESEYAGFLDKADGCALLPHGVLFYFHPYKIDAGAAGQYNSLIPSSELKSIMKVWSLSSLQ